MIHPFRPLHIRGSLWLTEPFASLSDAAKILYLGFCATNGADGRVTPIFHKRFFGPEVPEEVAVDAWIELRHTDLIKGGPIRTPDVDVCFLEGHIRIPVAPRTKAHIPAALRRAVYQRDGSTCRYCGATDLLSIDHVYPESKGGETILANLQTLCRSCNSRKKDRLEEVFLGTS